MTKIKVKSPDNSAFHLPDVVVFISGVSDEHKVGESRRVNFLILGDQKHGGDSDQLKLLTCDLMTFPSHESVIINIC